MNNRKFKTFQQAFLSINKEIIENPTYKTNSRIGDVQEISNYNYEVSDMSTYEFPNPLIGRLDYNYGAKFYEWMITGSTDPDSLTKDYPNTARFMEKPKSDLLPQNFNTFYGPRIIEQLPYIVKELKDNPNSRRAVISILEKTDLLLLDKDETLEFPCADSATFFIREGKLNAHLHMRSQNMGQVLKLDMYLWARFTKELAFELNIPTGTFSSSIVSAHVFTRDFEYLKSLQTL